MFRNSVPTSDSKQCPESKLGQVHSVHTLNPGWACNVPRPRAHAARWVVLWSCPDRVAACGRPCRSLWPTVSQRLHGRVMAYIATQRRVSSPLLVTIQILYRDLAPVARATARIAAPSAVSWLTVAVSQAESSVVSWPTMHTCCALCHDTVYCIVTQNSKWAVAQPAAFCLVFFHTHRYIYIFLLSNYWKTS